MKIAKFPWRARDDRTLDPKHLNENFRKGADYIRDVLDLRYTYSSLEYNLEGIDLADDLDERTFFIMPPGILEFTGAELTITGLTAGQNVFVRWLSDNEVASVPVMAAAGTGAPSPVAIVLPVGGPTEAWRWVETEHSDQFPISQNITQRALSLDLDPPLGAYAFEIGTDADTPFALGAGCSLSMWLKFSRGTNPDFDLPDMFSGRLTADATRFNLIQADLETQRLNAVGNTPVFKGECYVVNGVSNSFVINMGHKLYARFPSINTDSGTDWILHSYHMLFVSEAANFSSGNIRDVTTRLTEVSAATSIGQDVTRLDGGLLPPGIKTLYRIVSNGLPASMADTVGVPTTPGSPADDWFFDATDTFPGGEQNIKRVCIYLWYVNAN